MEKQAEKSLMLLRVNLEKIIRGTFQEFLGWIKVDKIDYTGVSIENIEKKVYLSENRKKTEYYYISLDKNGKLPFPIGYGNFGGKIDCHIITILSEDVDIKYLAYLQKIGVSFIFAGEKNIDLKIALKKLKDLFGIEKIPFTTFYYFSLIRPSS